MAQDSLQLPSGAQAQLYEVIGQGTAEVRLRYVSAGFDPRGADTELLLADMTFICETNVLEGASQYDTPQNVIVSLADRPSEFGVLNTEVQQIFEAFSVDDNTCIWEAF
ncbi:DUF6497 family protein [Roseovarius sp. Pro17]|uniref:DUF6497 family protein n=1 Tax=Roseovarius sp. Pro17 TaxID=3108175 RepID=UPI002D776964|nr:DUF6497 family protein [Roseovarius sp. Pro17]